MAKKLVQGHLTGGCQNQHFNPICQAVNLGNFPCYIMLSCLLYSNHLQMYQFCS